MGEMDSRGLVFLAAFVVVTSLAAWFCFNRLFAAQETGRFRYIFHGINEAGWPLLFQFCKAFITVQAYVFCFMAGVGVIWFAISLIGKIK